MSKTETILEGAGSLLGILGYFFDKDRINMARAKASIDAAERYMMVNEGDAPYDKIDAKRKEKLLRHYRKRFIAYN